MPRAWGIVVGEADDPSHRMQGYAAVAAGHQGSGPHHRRPTEEEDCEPVNSLTSEPSCKDEARVGQKGSLTYVWAPVGSRPPMVRDNRHGSAYLFGAICPARGVGAAVITPAANTAAMNAHLAEIGTQVAPGAHAVLLLDRAGWHQRGKRLCVPANITLLDLPAYSPELNPMETVWEFLRGNKLSGLVWDTYEAIIDACVSAWHFLIGDPERIRSIGTRDWACVSL